MSAYIAIRVLLLLALALTAWWLVRPVSSASSLALRRIGIGVLVAAAIVAILVPSLANTVARAIADGDRVPARGPGRGTHGDAGSLARPRTRPSARGHNP